MLDRSITPVVVRRGANIERLTGADGLVYAEVRTRPAVPAAAMPRPFSRAGDGGAYGPPRPVSRVA